MADVKCYQEFVLLCWFYLYNVCTSTSRIGCQCLVNCLY